MSAATDTAVTRRELAFRGGELTVLEAGQGPTVGYLHGMIGLPGSGLPPLLTDLAADHRVIAPCLPGFTGSSVLEDLRGLFDWVVALSEIVDLAGLTGAPVVASSVGAMLAMELAAVRPEAFSQLVLLAPMGLWDGEEPVADAFGTTLSEQRALLTADPAATAVFFDDDPDVTDPAARIEQGVSRYLTRTAAASLVWPIPEHGLAQRTHLVRQPVTLVWGGADRLVPPSYAARFAAVLPAVTARHDVAGAGHLVDWDSPSEVAAIVRGAIG